MSTATEKFKLISHAYVGESHSPSMLYVSAHTRDARYKAHADRLVGSALRYELNSLWSLASYSAPTVDTWNAGTLLKIRTLWAMFSRLKSSVSKWPRWVIWIDADAEFVASPIFLAGWLDVRLATSAPDYEGRCIAFRSSPKVSDLGLPRPLIGSGSMSGVVAFHVPHRQHAALDRWMRFCEKWHKLAEANIAVGMLEQEALPRAARLVHARVLNLSERFVYIPDLMPGLDDPAILHHQASREMRS